MAYFSYKAIDSKGDVVKGLIEETHVDQAYDNISALGLNILNIQPSGRLADFYFKKVRVWGIKGKDTIEFASNLAIMLRAGLPLVTSISDIAETMDNQNFRERLLDIKRTIELGSGFSAALAQHKEVFPEIFINLVAVGEETGRLDKSLTDIAVHMQRMEDLKSAIIRALMYPTFALIGTTGALLFWLIYVLPKMTGLFTSMEMDLPVLTQVLIIASDFSQRNWPLFIAVPVVIYIAGWLCDGRGAARP